MKGEPLPKVPLGTTFLWNNRMWKRGRGIIYVAHPCKDPMIEAGYRRRLKKRLRKAAERIRK